MGDGYSVELSDGERVVVSLKQDTAHGCVHLQLTTTMQCADGQVPAVLVDEAADELLKASHALRRLINRGQSDG